MVSRACLTLLLIAALAGSAHAQTSSVIGSVVYRERVELSRTTVLEITLADVSASDGSAKVIAIERVARPDHLPVMFSLHYDSARVVPSGRYAVSARVIDGGAVLFSSPSPARVLTQGHGSVANLIVAKAEPAPASTPAPTPATKERKPEPAPAPKATPTPAPRSSPTPKPTPAPAPKAAKPQPTPTPKDDKPSATAVKTTTPAPKPTPATSLSPPPTPKSTAAPAPKPTPATKPVPVALPARPAATSSLPPQPIADLPAVFAGALPCQDCRAIDYELTLNADWSYTLRKTKTLDGSADRVEDESGSWDYSSDRIVMVLKSRSGTWSWFAMPAPGVLRAIDSRGNSIGLRTGADLTRGESVPAAASSASLNPNATREPVTLALSGAEWIVTELENKPVRPVSKTQRAIVLAFDEDSRTISGASGCNPLDGTFEAGWRTLILKPNRPLRVCLADAGTERAVGRTMKATRSYRVTGTTLDLFDEQGARIARLEGTATARK